MVFRSEPEMALLMFGLIVCSRVNPVAAVECTVAIVASVFGTLGAVLLIGAVVALGWFYCRRKTSDSSGSLSVETASEPDLEDGTKSKGRNIGVALESKPVTFSHRYSEKAPSAPYNTSGVVNPAFAGIDDVIIDVPPKKDVMNPAFSGSQRLLVDGARPQNKEVVVDIEGDPTFSGSRSKLLVDEPSAQNNEVVVDIEGDPALATDHVPDGRFSTGRFPNDLFKGIDADVVVADSPEPELNSALLPGHMETVDAYLDRPRRESILGLLIEVDKTSPVLDFVVSRITPGGIADASELIDEGDKIVEINGTSVEGMTFEKAQQRLRDTEPEKLHLKLLKCGRNSGYNTTCVVNPAFAGSQELLIDSPSVRNDEVSIDMDGDLSLRTDTAGRNLPTGRFSSGHLDGLDGGVTVDSPPAPKLDLTGPNDLETVDVHLNRPESGSYGLLIGRDKNKTTPALFIREVTSGGPAAATALVDEGDQIIGINGTSVEGMRPAEAMNLLRDTEAKTLHLKLLKCGRNTGLDASFYADIPDAHYEGEFGASRNLDKERDIVVPTYDASTGATRIERDTTDLQMTVPGGNVALNANGPNGGVSAGKPGFELDSDLAHSGRTQRKLKTDISGPDIDGNVGIDRPSVGAKPSRSTKMKRGSFLLCVSSSDKEEPYKRKRGNHEFDFNGPKVDGSTGKFDVDTSGPGDDRSGRKAVDIHLGASGPGIDISKEKEIVDTNIGIAQADASMPSTSGSTRRPSIDGTALDWDIREPDSGVSSKAPQPGWGGNSLEVETRGGEFQTKLSGSRTGLMTERTGRPKGGVSAPGAETDLSTATKWHGKCFSCTPSARREEPYRSTVKRKGDGEFDWNAPEVPESIEMKRFATYDVTKSDPDLKGFDSAELHKEVELHTARPDLEVSNGDLKGNMDISGPAVEGDVEIPDGNHYEDIDLSGPNVSMPSTRHKGDFSLHSADGERDLDFDARRPNADISRRNLRMKVETGSADINAPENKNVKAKAAIPRAGMNRPSSRKKRSNCLSCTPKADKDEPYRKTRADGDLSFGLPEVHGSRRGLNVGGKLDAGVSEPNSYGFEGREVNKKVKLDADRPDIDIPRGKLDNDIEFSGANVSKPSTPDGGKLSMPSVNGGDLDFQASGPGMDISTRKPQVDADFPGLESPEEEIVINGSGPDLDGMKPEGKLNGGLELRTGGPDVDNPDGTLVKAFDLPDPNFSMPSGGHEGEFSLPSVDGEGDLEFDGSGPNADISRRNLQIKVETGSPDIVASKKRDVKAEADIPRAGINRPSLSMKRINCVSCTPKADKDEPYRKTRADGDLSFGLPEVRGCRGDLKVGSALDAGVSEPSSYGFEGREVNKKVKLDANRPDIDIPRGNLDNDIEFSGANVSKPSTPDGGKFSMPSVNGGDVDFQASGPGMDISTRKPQVDPDFPGLESPEGEIGINRSGPDLDGMKPKGKLNGGLELPTGGPDVDNPDGTLVKAVDLPGPNFSMPSGGHEGEFSLPSVDGEGDLKFDGSGPNADISRRNLQMKVETGSPDIVAPKKRDVKAEADIPKAGINRPSLNMKHINCLSCTPKADKDEPYRKTRADGDLSFGLPEVRNSRGDLKVGSALDAEVSEPSSYGFEGRELNKEVRLGTNRPDIDIPRGNLDNDIEFSGANVSTPSTPERKKFSIPSVNGGDLDFQASGPGMGFSTRKPQADANFPGHEPLEREIVISGSGPDLDGMKPEGKLNGGLELRTVGPDVDNPDGPLVKAVDLPGPTFSMPSEGPEGEFSLPSVDGGDLEFDGRRRPNAGISTRNLQMKVETGSAEIIAPENRDLKAEVDIPRGGMKRPSFPDLESSQGEHALSVSPNGPDFNILKGNVDNGVGWVGPEFSVPSTTNSGKASMPSKFEGDVDTKRLNADISKPSVSMSSVGPKGNLSVPVAEEEDVNLSDAERNMHISVRQMPTGLDTNSPSIDSPAGKFKTSGSIAAFNLDRKTSTPKRHVSGLQIDPIPNLEGDVFVEDVSENLKLASPPEMFQNGGDTFPPSFYEEPHSLQRFDEIRPNMELKLYSPESSTKAMVHFDFKSLDDSLDGSKQLETTPPTVTLVKVQENLSVYSASIEENTTPPAKNVAFVLDRQVHQKLELVIPDENHHPNSPPTSSGWPHDTGKPSSELKRTSSKSSSSSSEGSKDSKKRPKRKRKIRSQNASRKSSTSSKSSAENDRGVPVSSSSSSSSDDTPSVIHRDNWVERKSSESSPFSSEDKTSKSEKPADGTPSVGEDLPRTTSRFETPKPFPEVKLEQGVDQQERRPSTSSSSSSDEEITVKEEFLDAGYPANPAVTPAVDYAIHQQGVRLNDPKENEPKLIEEHTVNVAVKEKAPEPISLERRPTDPDFSFMSTSQPPPARDRKTSTSSSSSSDEETEKNKDILETSEDTKPTIEYNVRHLRYRYTIPHSKEEQDEPVAVEEKAPEPISLERRPTDPDFSFMSTSQPPPARDRKTSTSSSSSSDEDKEKNKDIFETSEDTKPTIEYNVDHLRYQHTIPHSKEEQDEPVAVGEKAPEAISLERRPTDPDFSFMLTASRAPTERKSSNSSSSSSSDDDTASDHDVPKTSRDEPCEGPAATYTLEKPIKQIERKSSTSSSSDDEDKSRVLTLRGLKVQPFETTYHVDTLDYPTTHQDTTNSEAQEHPPMVVSPSVSRVLPDGSHRPPDHKHEEPQLFTSSTEIHFSEPNMDARPQVEYHYNLPSIESEVNDVRQQEAVIGSPSVKNEMPYVEEHPKTLNSTDTDKINGLTSHPWNVQVGTYETVYRVLKHDYPADGPQPSSSEVREDSPIVVSRSVRRTGPDVSFQADEESESPVFSSVKDVEFSEPSIEYYVDYPQVTTRGEMDEHNQDLREEVIKPSSRSLEYNTPDISLLLSTSNEHDDTERSMRSPNDAKSPKTPNSDIKKSGSNSRLWDLMQGYLIEESVLDDDATSSTSETPSEPQKVEPDKPIVKGSHVDVAESVVPNTEVVVSWHTEPTTVAFEPQKRHVVKGTILHQAEPRAATFTIQSRDVIKGETSTAKERTPPFRGRQFKAAVDDDNPDDPWMKHYSRGLERGFSHQPKSGSSLEPDTSLNQNRDSRFRKVPHVREVKQTEPVRQKAKYVIQVRRQSEPTTSRTTTDRSRLQDQPSDRGDVGERRPVRPVASGETRSLNELRSLWDHKSTSPSSYRTKYR